MQKAWTPPARFVFGAATLLGVFSTLQSYRINVLNVSDPMPFDIWRTLALNLWYWYVPATLTSTIFKIANRFSPDSLGWQRTIAIHVVGAFSFSIVHEGAMIAARIVLWRGRLFTYPSWPSIMQRLYLQNLDWALMTYSAIAGASYAIGYYRESRTRAIRAAHLETRLAQARLKTLEAELHPHFLFNTLHAISTLVYTQPESADRMISRLSDLLRITFSRSEAACVSLHEELEFLQKYLEIEQTRFQDRLTVDYEIDPDTLDAEVPRLILQPLVENAIKHGIAPRTDRGHVQIVAGRQEDTLWMEVRDNGGGLHGGTLTKLRTGVGLSNTRARLQCLYAGQHRLEFSDRHGGLAVRVEIPFERHASSTSGAAFRV